MRKYFTAAVALALVASVLTGCRNGNVSNQTDGVITDPTVTSGTMATMPSTDTAPIGTTAPSASTDSTIHPGNGNPTDATDGNGHTDATDGTGHTDATGESGTAKSRARHVPGNMG